MAKIQATLVSDTLPEGTMGAVTAKFDNAEDLANSIVSWIKAVPAREIHITIPKGFK